MKQFKARFFKGLLIILALLAVAVTWYVFDDYDASDFALEALSSTETVEVVEGNPIQFFPEGGAEVGFIFYPGGKVEEEAYAPLMQGLAELGYAGFLVDMPLGLAVLDINAATEIIGKQPDISEWYIAGHSLGGSMAAFYADRNSAKLDGLIMLAAYSTADLSQKDLPVLAVYGSEDQVIDADKVVEYQAMLPPDAVEVVIEGGNHAQFGSYGVQARDGEAAITEEAQREGTLEAIRAFIEGN